MPKLLLYSIIPATAVCLFVTGLWVGYKYGEGRLNATSMLTPLGLDPRPLDAYTIDNLGKRAYEGSKIILEKPIATESAYTSYIFSYRSDGKQITGITNIPEGQGPFPVILQIRGYIDPGIYQSGDGTRRSGQVFAQNGYLTLAPDFLGYGGSDKTAEDIFEQRFQTYTAVLNLMASVRTLPKANPEKVFLWGHSNGGHIALTVKEILASVSGQLKMYQDAPLVLWAPVTKPFPYSVLYYTDESPDEGKFLRHETVTFEDKYDARLFSLTHYLDRINGEIQLHQGEADDAVPVLWTDEFVNKLKLLNKEVTYYKYPGAGHNMEGVWTDVIARDVRFYNQFRNN